MEIDFNPSRIPKPDSGVSQPVTRRAVSPDVSAAEPLQNAASLESKLQAIPLVRPGRVEHAKTLAANVMYPPVEMLDGISALLAIHLSKNQ